MFRVVAIVALVAGTSALAAGSKAEVRYDSPSAWVQPPPLPTDAATPADAPFRFIYSDTQVHVLPSGIDTYSAYRVRILKPEALQMGNVAVVWNPTQGDVSVHYVRIIRDGKVIDVLKSTRLQVIQREETLEQSMITGNLTALLQVPGLQVGDELEVATTLRSRDPTLGDHAFGLFQLPTNGLPGAFRLRLSWPDAVHVTFRGSRDMAVAVPQQSGRERAISYELRDPRGVIVNEGAPDRFNIRRLIEFSDFANWAEVSGRIWPLFGEAARLAPDSPLRARVASIAAATSDPAERALAALKLVQDEIRYVYVGFNGGNYRPASADETWSRRFGDCKGKTALLLALLHELGIEAEPVLVRVSGDDGLEERLPNPALFNHVLVRVKIGDKSYWLDGTRRGDRYLDNLPPPAFGWALPVEERDAALEQVKVEPFTRPQFIGVLDMDASPGFEQPARISLQYVMRGDEAYSVQTSLAALSAEDADRALRAYWRQEESWVDPERVAWRYDERRKTVSLSLVGTGKPDWDGDDADGHDLTIWGAGFVPPDRLRRSKEQDNSAPWLTDFPKFKCWATTIHLPRPGARRQWAYDAEAMNRQIGGVTYWRQAGLESNVIRTVMSRSVALREISAEQASAQNDAIPGFNNRMSRVFEETYAGSSLPSAGQDKLPIGDKFDWVTDDAPCIPQP